MPVILSPEEWTSWLDPANDDLDAITAMLDGADEDVLTMHPVSTDVNNVRNNRHDLVDALA
jgi:putative SOS response-associated peptidase YedK